MVVTKERKRTVQAKNAHTHTHVQKKKNTSAVLHSTHTDKTCEKPTRKEMKKLKYVKCQRQAHKGLSHKQAQVEV